MYLGSKADDGSGYPDHSSMVAKGNLAGTPKYRESHKPRSEFKQNDSRHIGRRRHEGLAKGREGTCGSRRSRS
jgi:hypothetical protein